MTWHVVCRECGDRWQSAISPRQCRDPECDAGWLDLPMFEDKSDADSAAEKFAAERASGGREPMFS